MTALSPKHTLYGILVGSWVGSSVGLIQSFSVPVILFNFASVGAKMHRHDNVARIEFPVLCTGWPIGPFPAHVVTKAGLSAMRKTA